VTPTIESLEELIGHRLPGGSYTIEPYINWLTNDVVLADQPGGDVANPMFCYYGALAAMGISIDDMFALAGATADDGPMFGEAGIELSRPLTVGATYAVSGEITGAVRKEGKKTGVFDIVTFRIELNEPDGELAAVSTNSFVFPRRES